MSNAGTLWRLLGLHLAAALCLCAGCGGHSLHVPGDGAADRPYLPDDSAEDSPALAPDAANFTDAEPFGAADRPYFPDDLAEDGSALAPDAATYADAREFLDTVAPDSRVSDTRDAGPDCVLTLQPDIPSRQSVRFQFVSSSSGYLITTGVQCGAFLIDRLDADGGPRAVQIGTYQVILCEGPAPSAPGVGAAVALNQAAVSVLSWDARELQPYQVCVDCAARGWPGMPSYAVTLTSSAPVGPGRYRATFAVLDTLPSWCRGDSGEYTCGWYYPGAYGTYVPWGLCPGFSRTLSVEFELPASGDLDVTVVDQG